MTEEYEDPGSPVEWTRNVLTQAWRDTKSVYYANTTIWRLLKSAALVFLGLFTWTGANLLLSYRPDWGFLYYVLSYGFLVIFWGPFTHLVIVPLIIRFRRSGEGGFKRVFWKYATKTNLTIFIVLVLLLGTYPIGPMLFQFQLPTGGDGPLNVDPQLQCTKSPEVIHCHLSDSRGIDTVVVSSGGETLERIEDPPYDFDIQISEIESSRDQQEFTVELRDENGNTIRRYIRRVSLIPGE